MNHQQQSFSRRGILQAGLAGACAAATPRLATADETKAAPAGPLAAYENQAKGIRIFPGMWRPHYPWEHIAWVSPSWPCQDYIWIDLPEAIFTGQGLLFVSSINPDIEPMLFPHLPAIPWRRTNKGIAFTRTLPNGIIFGSTVTQADNAVDLEIFIHNGTDKPLTDIRMQTCFYLRAIKEFAAHTADNKFVHVADHGWLPFEQAKRTDSDQGRYRLGWRSGPQTADQPIMVTTSARAERLIACTWGEATYSMVTNPGHPCMHADPAMPDIPPGGTERIHGKLFFFEGPLAGFQPSMLK